MEASVNKPDDGTDVIGKAEDEGGSGAQLTEDERTRLAAEFNIQRAKMKELFLQKEEEMRRTQEEKEQLQSEILGLRAEVQQLQTLTENQKSEIQSLQLLIHETVEASSSGTEELRRLAARNQELEHHLNLISKQQLQQQKEAQEDAELLRSLVEPLEEEIHALKEKLRDTDNQLQLATQPKKSSGKGDSKECDAPCDMCLNYESQLVTEQRRSAEATTKARNAERALKIATEELEGARSVHEETVRAWRSERAASTSLLSELRASVEECRKEVSEGAERAEAAARSALQQVTSLTVQRQTLQERLDTLQKDNDMLIGKYTKKASELQNEDINLPDTVEELQECCLKLREELIMSGLGLEESLETERTLRSQLMQLTAEYHKQTSSRQAADTHYQQLRQHCDQLEAEREQMKDLGNKLHQSSNRIEELLNDKKRLQNEVVELRSRISSLQQELDNSEKVQQDFVRLSQSLQVQLERIREADTEVRWQHDDDVTECPSCHAALNNNKHKVHCRHCGRIFCGSCVCHAVPAGPRRTPARVCSVCRTLLQPHTAPYFSTQPPNT